MHVQFIDHYGQLVTNATQEWLKAWLGEKSFVALARGRRVTKHVHSSTEMQDAGELYTRINRYGYLELGVCKPGAHGINTAASLLGMAVRDPIELQRKVITRLVHLQITIDRCADFEAFVGPRMGAYCRATGFA